MTNIFIKKTEIRNPFSIISLPFAAKVYSLRKGRYAHFSFFQKMLKLMIPGRPFLSWLLKYFPMGRFGSFAYDTGEEKKEIFFNIRNTQFHSVYFPQYQKSYEPETTVLIDLILKQNPKGVFFDIGANWGHMSLHAASSKSFEGEIHSFEPFPTTYEDLSKIVRESGKKDLIFTYNMAVSDFDGPCFIGLPDHFNSGNAEVSSIKNSKKNQDLQVQASQIDSMNLKSPDLMKIDVEGFEINVLRGARKTLLEKKPMIIFENWSDLNKVKDTLAPFSFLKSLGYHFFEPSFLIGGEKSSEKGKSYFAGYSHLSALNLLGSFECSAKAEKETPFALIEFIPEQRFLLKEQLNIFACHQKNLDFLKEHFDLY